MNGSLQRLDPAVRSRVNGPLNAGLEEFDRAAVRLDGRTRVFVGIRVQHNDPMADAGREKGWV